MLEPTQFFSLFSLIDQAKDNYKGQYESSVRADDNDIDPNKESIATIVRRVVKVGLTAYALPF